MLNFMKIELDNNKVFFIDENLNEEIHPFWLRERVENVELLDQKHSRDYLIQAQWNQTSL